MKLTQSEYGRLGWLASKATQEKKKQIRIENYNKNPSTCLYCGKCLDYKHRHNKFCDQSCGAKYNNSKRPKKIKEKTKRLSRFEKHILENGDIINCTEQTARRIAKDYLIKHNGHKCMICGNSEWLGHPILLIADHIDGDPTNNNINNFRIICSNCDATLDTYKNKNRNKKKRINRKKYYTPL